ncbi:MAG: polyprenyl synthetase family protein [Candidatus Bathyarchaeum tardum]|nr:MAG: polyprenyl synthetase family protein [Candidatus Bathyarchaeum tardum]
MNWEETLDHYGAAIEDRLKAFLNEAIKEATEYHPFVGEVYRDIADFVLRKGKRLASCSTLLVYKGYTGEVDEKILKVCVGVELYRHAILIHDDLVDMDEQRRGRETLHIGFTNRYAPYDVRFGEDTAVFAANIAYALAVRAIMESNFSEESTNRVLCLTSEGYRAVNESQILDLLFEQKAVTEEEWNVMASKRAASLFKVTLVTGAILAKAPETDFSILAEAAAHMGFSFDIQDDIIDTFAEKEEYGKSSCLDISKNKKPLHVVLALNSKDVAHAEGLKCLMGKQFLSFGEKDLARQIIRESGALDMAKHISREHAQVAKTELNKTSLTDDIKQFFNSFILYIEQSLDWYK